MFLPLIVETQISLCNLQLPVYGLEIHQSWDSNRVIKTSDITFEYHQQLFREGPWKFPFLMLRNHAEFRKNDKKFHIETGEFE